MPLTRTMLNLLIALGVAVVGGGVYFALNQDRVVSLVTPKKTVNTNRATTTNVPDINAVPHTNISVPSEIRGDTVFTGELTLAGVPIKLSSVQKSPTYIDIKAAEGKTLMVVFIDPVQSSQVPAVINAVGVDIHLDHGTNSVSPRRTKIAGDQIKNDRGYMIFEIPANATKLTLISGTGPTATRLTLPGS